MRPRRPRRGLRRATLWAAAVGTAFLAAPASGEEISIWLEQFGAGAAFRPGDWTGIRLRLENRGREVQQVRIEWEIPDAEGDTAAAARTAVVAPGRPAERWLYGRIPPAPQASATAAAGFTVRVFEDLDGRRGRELAAATISPADAASAAVAVELDEGLFGVVAPPSAGGLGLEAYESPPPGLAFIPSMNERTRLATGIPLRELPDRWEGWWSFDLLVWAGSDPARRPERAGLDEGKAIREWIERGGRLVVVLPESNDPWLADSAGSPQRHFLSDLMPPPAASSRTTVPVAAILPAISKSPSLRDPAATIALRSFDPAKLGPEWQAAAALPRNAATEGAGAAGGVFAIRRRVDFGEVILLGIDLEALRRMGLQEGGLPEADCLWNPLLGRRGDSLTAGEYAALDDADPRRLLRREGDLDELGGGRLIADRIDLSGRAVLGLLAAIGIFGAYWLLAGPLGFALLRHLRRERLAWLAFVLVGIAFTAAAWAGGSLLRQSRSRIVHVSFVDRVASSGEAGIGESRQLQRVESWFTVALPGYGTASISLPDGGEGGGGNLLSSWIAPPGDRRGRYPDTARYEVATDRRGVLEVPARATAATFAASWIGVLPPSFGEWPRPLPGHPIEVVTDPNEADPTVLLRGRLQHRLSGTLTGVRIIHVNPYLTPSPRFIEGSLPIVAEPGRLAACGRFVIVAEWAPGDTLDLATLLYPEGPLPARQRPPHDLASQIRMRYSDPIVGRGAFGGRVAAADDPLRAFDMLSLGSILTPPPYLQNPPPPIDPLRVRRTLGRRLDLGGWLSQPCLVIVGYLRDSEMPAAATVDGESPPTAGLTVLRWILPLPALPEAVAGPAGLGE